MILYFEICTCHYLSHNLSIMRSLAIVVQMNAFITCLPNYLPLFGFGNLPKEMFGHHLIYVRS